MNAISLSYYGWSAFKLEGLAAGPLILDPTWRPLLDERWAGLEDFQDAAHILVTHGHNEHLRDVAPLHRATGAPVAGPPHCMDFLRQHQGLQAARDIRVEDEWIEYGGVRLRALDWPHLSKHDIPGKLRILSRNHPLGAMRLVARWWWQVAAVYWRVRHQPEGPPFFAYDMILPDGQRVLFTCEAFTHLLDPAVVAGWIAEGPPVDWALVGVESGQEEAAARLTAELRPRRVIQVVHHEQYERFYGHPAVEPERYRSCLRRLCPGLPVASVQPGTRLVLTRPAGAP